MDLALKRILQIFGLRSVNLQRRLPIATKLINSQLISNNILENLSFRTISLDFHNDAQSISEAIVQEGYIINSDSSSRNAIVFDARSIKDVKNLKLLHTYLNPVISELTANGRIVIIGGDCHPFETKPSNATVNGAIGGFVRALSKEVASKGITVNMLQMSYNSPGNDELSGTLNFLLSKRSAFITGQCLRITPLSPLAHDPNSNYTKSPKDIKNKIFNIKEKKVLITGASRGIGESIAKLFHAEGATVLLLDHPSMENQLKDLSKELNNSSYITLDITKENANSILHQYMKSSYLKNDEFLDIVIHNAGITIDKTFKSMKEIQFSNVIDVNLKAIIDIDKMLLTKNWRNNSIDSNSDTQSDARSDMGSNPRSSAVLADGGRMVYLSSISGIAGAFGQSNYSCSKAGIISYVSAQSHQLQSRQIGVNAIAPGFIESDMTKRIPFMTRNIGRYINALGQPGYPVDIAETALFLSSPASSGMNGVTIRVCGGHMVGQ